MKCLTKMSVASEKIKSLSGDTMQSYTHIIPFHDRAILYLNGSMKSVLLSPEEYQMYLAGTENPVLAQLLSENRTMYHHQSELRLGAVGLTLNVANTCNLRCSYCYANGGNYNSENAIMSANTAALAVRVFAKHFGELKRVKFFGGEPFLNPQAIRAACEACVKLTEDGVLKRLPDFTTVTNGTVLTQELIELIKQYDIGVTVSFDGNAMMQDTLRPYVSGNGSSEAVLKNVKLLQLATNQKQPSSVEVTYTQIHIQKGVSVEQCYQNVKELLNIDDIKITPVSCEEDDEHHLLSIDSFNDAVKAGYQKTPCDIRVVEKAYRLHQILTFRKRSERLFCGAGINRFSVSADGKVYPCYLFTNDAEFCIGNILDSCFSLENYEPTRLKLMEYDRLVQNECKDCWASSFCFGCRGNNRRLTGKSDTPSEDFCRMLKEVAGNLLCCMAESGEIRTLDDFDVE